MAHDNDSGERLVNLEDPAEADTAVLVRYRGVLLPLTRDRLLQMLRREEAYLAGEKVTTPSPRPVAEVARVPAPASSEPRAARLNTRHKEGISHAGLSVRVKRMYSYCFPQKKLRATHAEHLEQVLASFDWIFPDHPNTLLDFHLREISGWAGVTPELRSQIDDFLARYLSARQKKTSA